MHSEQWKRRSETACRFCKKAVTGQNRNGGRDGGLCPLCLLHWHEDCGRQLAAAVDASDAPQDMAECLRSLRRLPQWMTGTLGCTAHDFHSQQQPLLSPSPRTALHMRHESLGCFGVRDSQWRQWRGERGCATVCLCGRAEFRTICRTQCFACA